MSPPKNSAAGILLRNRGARNPKQANAIARTVEVICLLRRNGCAQLRTGMALLPRSGDGQSVAALPGYFRPRFLGSISSTSLDAQVCSWHELPVRRVAQVRQLSGVHLTCGHPHRAGEF
jgi:hypothetical protein